MFQDIPNDENYSCFGVDQSLGRSADSSFASAKGVKKNSGEQKNILTDKRNEREEVLVILPNNSMLVKYLKELLAMVKD